MGALVKRTKNVCGDVVTLNKGTTVTFCSLASILLLSGCEPHLSDMVRQSSAGTTTAVETANLNTALGVTVDVFGGSMAYGWVDPHHDSYLRRAFSLRSRETHVPYKYMNHALPGYTAQWMNQKYAGRYTSLLQRDKPQVAVLSWGLENDLSSKHRDSINTFGRQIRKEISVALKHHCVVLIVSPPMTKLLATTDRHKVGAYISKEFQIGQSFHNSHVVDIRLYHQMWMYIKAHHQTYRLYDGNSWHPNDAGHKLAGRLLASDLEKKFGAKPIVFEASSSGAQAL